MALMKRIHSECLVPHVAKAQPPPRGVAAQTIKVARSATQAACSALQLCGSTSPLHSARYRPLSGTHPFGMSAPCHSYVYVPF